VRQLDLERPSGHRIQKVVRLLAIPAAVLLIVAAALVLIRPSLPERRPVVRSVYCASSATWVTMLAPFFEPPAQETGQPTSSRVTSARIRSAYERRCTTSD
jgi:hypothetical protein